MAARKITTPTPTVDEDYWQLQEMIEAGSKAGNTVTVVNLSNVDITSDIGGHPTRPKP